MKIKKIEILPSEGGNINEKCEWIATYEDGSQRNVYLTLWATRQIINQTLYREQAQYAFNF